MMSPPTVLIVQDTLVWLDRVFGYGLTFLVVLIYVSQTFRLRLHARPWAGSGLLKKSWLVLVLVAALCASGILFLFFKEEADWLTSVTNYLAVAAGLVYVVGSVRGQYWRICEVNDVVTKTAGWLSRSSFLRAMIGILGPLIILLSLVRRVSPTVPFSPIILLLILILAGVFYLLFRGFLALPLALIPKRVSGAPDYEMMLCYLDCAIAVVVPVMLAVGLLAAVLSALVK